MNEKDYLLDSLSLLFASGVDALTALESLKKEIHSKSLRKKIDLMQQAITNGSPLHLALKLSGLWPDHVISLIKMGEESGNLIENLKMVSMQQQKERGFRSKVRSAMIYPVLVFSITIVVGLAVALFLLPKLAITFSQLRIELPLITRILIAVGIFLGKFGLSVVPGLLVLFLSAVFLLFFYQKTKFLGEVLLWQIPPIKKLISEVELSRLGYLLGTLLSSGISVGDALSSLAESTTSKSYQKLYFYLQQKVTEGNSFSASFTVYKKTSALIPAPVQQMIISSEQSGHLPQTLLKVGEIYEEKTEVSTKNLTVMLEPVLLVIVWLAVLAVALAVILPIYSLIGGLNK